MNRKYFSLLISLLLTSCNNVENPNSYCKVLIESNAGFTSSSNYIVVKKGGNACFTLNLNVGYTIDSVSYPDSIIENEASKAYITIKNVNYPVKVKIQASKKDLIYHIDDEKMYKSRFSPHVRANTLICNEIPVKEGYSLVGYKDDFNNIIGLGSRYNSTVTNLYPIYKKESDASIFNYSINNGIVSIDGINKVENEIVIPNYISNCPVKSISDNAFSNKNIDTIYLNSSLKSIGAKAFSNSSVKELYLYDSIINVQKDFLEGCTSLKTIHINANKKPAYSGTYFNTFEDKMDRLINLKDNKKIVLYGGSSVRFGYDSNMIDNEFTDYEVINMGVYAYSNVLPQLKLMIDYVNKEDIFLETPEFDTVNTQFATSNMLDQDFFKMIEGNYDLFTKLDIQDFSNVGEAFSEFIKNKAVLPEGDYLQTPSLYDENKKIVGYETYNHYGDFILKRENGPDDKMYTVNTIDYTTNTITEEAIQSLDNQLQLYSNKGVKTYFNFAPRNIISLNSSSTIEARKEVQEILEKTLSVPVIGNIEESLFSPKYFYETDNHLSDEGVAIRTKIAINDLKKQLKKEYQ